MSISGCVCLVSSDIENPNVAFCVCFPLFCSRKTSISDPIFQFLEHNTFGGPYILNANDSPRP